MIIMQNITSNKITGYHSIKSRERLLLAAYMLADIRAGERSTVYYTHEEASQHFKEFTEALKFYDVSRPRYLLFGQSAHTVSWLTPRMTVAGRIKHAEAWARQCKKISEDYKAEIERRRHEE